MNLRGSDRSGFIASQFWQTFFVPSAQMGGTISDITSTEHILMVTRAANTYYASLRCKRFGRRGGWHDVSIGNIHEQNPTAGFCGLGLLTGANAPKIVVKAIASSRLQGIPGKEEQI